MNEVLVETYVDKTVLRLKNFLLGLRGSVIFNVFANIISVFSLVFFTMAMAVSKTRFDFFASVLISFGTGFYLFLKKDFLYTIIKNMSSDTLVISAIFSALSFFHIKSVFTISSEFGKFMLDYSPALKYAIYIGFSVCIFLFMNYIMHEVISFFKSFYKTLTKNEKIFALLSFALITLAITGTYVFTTGFWDSFDRVYSIDAGYVTRYIISNLYYNDVRHPSLNLLFLPYELIGNVFEYVFKIENIKFILIGIINAFLLVIVGLILKKVTNNKYVLLLYSVSLPTIIFSLFIEKYNIAALLFALALYAVYKNKSGLSLKGLTALSIGVMASSVLLSPVMIYEKEKRFKENIKRLIVTGIITIVFLAVIGKLDLIINLFSHLSSTTRFTHQHLSLPARLNSFFSFLVSCFIPLEYGLNDKGVFTWLNVYNSINLLGVIILIFCIVGFIENKKKQPYILMFSALIMSFVLFVIISWSPDESPLFGIYFSWAVIPLFVSGISCFFKENSKRYKVVLSLIIAIVSILNLEQAVQIIKYMLQNFKI